MAARWGSDNQLYKRYIAELVNLYGTRSDIRAFTEVILSVVAIFVFGVFLNLYQHFQKIYLI